MDLLTNEEILSILLFLDRDNLETLQQTNIRLTRIVTDCMNGVCLRYFEYADLSKQPLGEELRAVIQRDGNSVRVIEPKKNVRSVVETFTERLRMSGVDSLSVSDCIITPGLCEALNGVSSTIVVNYLRFSFVHFDVEFEAFHAMIHAFRCVKDFYISTGYADCANDPLLTGLAAKGTTKFYLVAYKDRDSSRNRPQCGITVDGLLVFCFGNRQSSVNEKRTVRLECMHVSDDFFAQVIHASKEAKHNNDVELQIETNSRTLPMFPPELEITPALQDGRNLYKYALVDGRPRTVTVELRFNDVNDHSTMGPCYRTAKRRPGRLHHDVLIVTFT